MSCAQVILRVDRLLQPFPSRPLQSMCGCASVWRSAWPCRVKRRTTCTTRWHATESTVRGRQRSWRPHPRCCRLRCRRLRRRRQRCRLHFPAAAAAAAVAAAAGTTDSAEVAIAMEGGAEAGARVGACDRPLVLVLLLVPIACRQRPRSPGATAARSGGGGGGCDDETMVCT